MAEKGPLTVRVWVEGGGYPTGGEDPPSKNENQSTSGGSEHVLVTHRKGERRKTGKKAKVYFSYWGKLNLLGILDGVACEKWSRGDVAGQESFH